MLSRLPLWIVGLLVGIADCALLTIFFYGAYAELSHNAQLWLSTSQPPECQPVWADPRHFPRIPWFSQLGRLYFYFDLGQWELGLSDSHTICTLSTHRPGPCVYIEA